jgi:hypothetical protein
MSHSPDNNASIKSRLLKNHTHPLCQSMMDGKVSQDEFWLKIAEVGTPLIESDPDHRHRHSAYQLQARKRCSTKLRIYPQYAVGQHGYW